MRIPIPNNRLVALTLAGALLTTVVAGGLAFPGSVSNPSGDDPHPTVTLSPPREVTEDAERSRDQKYAQTDVLFEERSEHHRYRNGPVVVDR